MLQKNSPQHNQKHPREKSTPHFSWSRCCCGAFSIITAARIIACTQILFATGYFLVTTLLGLAGEHEQSWIAVSFFIVSIVHVSLAILCAAITFLSLHYHRPWLLAFELVFLILAIIHHLAASVAFEVYILRDGLKWLTGQTQCYPTLREGFVCKPVPESDWPTIDWWNACWAGSHVLMAIIYMWFFGIILKCFFYSKRKREAEKRRREKAQANLGVGNGDGLMASYVGRQSMGGSTSMYSRCTMTTSLATSYDQSSRDPDLLLRY